MSCLNAAGTKRSAGPFWHDLVVDPDERFIIFNRYVDATRTLDLFISFRQGNEWSEPRALSDLNEDDRWELTPTLSPNGRHFFFEVDGRLSV